jgi:putative addiction module killer protein
MRRLSDRRARTAIAVRLARVENGNLGDHKIFDGIIELRIFYGPGYRLYGTIRDGYILLLMCGGNKSSQSRDIEAAKEMLHMKTPLEEDNGNNTA